MAELSADFAGDKKFIKAFPELAQAAPKRIQQLLLKARSYSKQLADFLSDREKLSELEPGVKMGGDRANL